MKSRRNMAIAEFELEKAIYNGEHDVTKIVKQLRPNDDAEFDNLPF
jgi:hypothetical protein